ncbi:MAG: hypothetical protein LBV69_07630 [Bacteroidales bacterium]|nr:hypothetical protein [Bacteroidales bacterium]
MNKFIKILFLFLLFFTNSNFIKSQDKIITINSDTINCRIIDISFDKITYYRKTEEGKWNKAYLPAKFIAEYYKISPEEWDIDEFMEQKEPFKLPEKPFGFIATIGFTNPNSFSLSNSNKSNKNSNRIFNSFYASSNFNLFLTEKIAVGAIYKFYSSKSILELGFDSLQYVSIFEDYSQNEKSCFNYFGVSLFLRKFVDKKHLLSINATFSIGYDFFLSKMNEDIYRIRDESLLITSGDFAVSADFSFEYYPLKHLSLSANFGTFYTEINKIKIKKIDQTRGGQKITERINSLGVLKINISLGIQFHF